MDIFVRVVSIVMCVMIIYIAIFMYIIPILRMKKKNDEGFWFPNEKVFWACISLTFVFSFLIIVLIFYSKIAIGAIYLTIFPLTIISRGIVIRSSKELFVNGKTIQLADIDVFCFDESIHTGYLTIILKSSRKPIVCILSKKTKRILSDLEACVKAGYYEDE